MWYGEGYKTHTGRSAAVATRDEDVYEGFDHLYEEELKELDKELWDEWIDYVLECADKQREVIPHDLNNIIQWDDEDRY